MTSVARAMCPTPTAPELRLVGEADTQTRIAELIDAYYTPYYRDALSMPDWPAHVQTRRNEEANFELVLANAERLALRRPINPRHRTLVVGAGTGADLMVLASRGCEVHGVEPNGQAIEIARLKCSARGIDPGRVVHGVGESLPYADQTFDFVWSWTVLEHVADERKTLSEIVRVLKPGGEAYIGTVDYRQFWEPHYKTHAPCMLGKAATKAWLRLHKKNPAFVDSLRFVTAPKIDRILRELGVVASRTAVPLSPSQSKPKNWKDRLVRWLTISRGVDCVQHWVIRKPA